MTITKINDEILEKSEEVKTNYSKSEIEQTIRHYEEQLAYFKNLLTYF